MRWDDAFAFQRIRTGAAAGRAGAYKDFETLRRAPYGRAYLNGGRLALSQYDPMTEWTEAPPAP